MSESSASFHVGQIIQHQLFGYRGAVYDVDATFAGSEEWYDEVANSRPPKDAPWYHVLVHDSAQTTYVAERNLIADPDPAQIDHPMLGDYFNLYDGTRYLMGGPSN